MTGTPIAYQNPQGQRQELTIDGRVTSASHFTACLLQALASGIPQPLTAADRGAMDALGVAVQQAPGGGFTTTSTVVLGDRYIEVNQTLPAHLMPPEPAHGGPRWALTTGRTVQ